LSVQKKLSVQRHQEGRSMQVHAQEMYTDQQLMLRELVSNVDTMELGELQALWKRTYGQRTFTRSRTYLRRLLRYRFREVAERGAAPEVRRAIRALATATPVVVERPSEASIKKQVAASTGTFRDPRLPPPGTVLRKEHRGAVHEVVVGENDCTYAGTRFRSLSAVAVKISGGPVNGYAFFARALRAIAALGTAGEASP
jgi:hypothetical protein